MASHLADVFIVAAKRTPFGTFGGKLAGLTATELGGIASKAALQTLPKQPEIDSIIFGNVLQTSPDAAYLSRHVGHRVGAPISTPALTINRLCGSGFQAVMNGVHEIRLGEANVVLAGGTENMSQAPYALRNVRWGTKYGSDLKMDDTLARGLVDSYPTPTPMGVTAENLAKKYKISRAECDEWALETQKRWATAFEAGDFDAELAEVELHDRKLGAYKYKKDEHPRPNATLESLAKLKPVFLKDGVVTAGNASGINDGAGAIVLASKKAVEQYGLKPLAKIVSYHVEGVDPQVMGYGPVPAILGALKKGKLSLDAMDRIEINEAFCAQFLACAKELKLDLKKTNMCGGATAVGHPLAASGARIVAHLTHALQKHNQEYAVGSACIGGGQGIAVILQKC